MFSAYIIKTMAAANKRLVNAAPSVYGFFNHVEKWDVSLIDERRIAVEHVLAVEDLKDCLFRG